MTKIIYEGHSVEVDFLQEFDYTVLFHWSSLKDCVFLDTSDLPVDVKTIIDFFHLAKPGSAFELENGGGIFGFTEKDIPVLGIRTEKSLYAVNGQEVVMYREDEVIHIDINAAGGYWKANALLRKAFLEAGSAAFLIRHHRYLDMILPIFARMVKFIEPKCMLELGFAAAHGDKCYQYKFSLEKAGVPFNRGTLLYLMTYTAIMDMEKSKSCEWVIKNYGRFRSILDTIEKSLGITDYLQEIQNVELLQPLYKSDGEAQSS